MRYFLFISLAVFLASCNLTQEVDIELPEYERQPVVECYIEPGKPFRLLLTQSYAFFDPFGLDSSFLDKTLLEDALVTIRYNGQTDTLENRLSFELNPLKIFNYTGQNIAPYAPGTTFELNITLPGGGAINGSAIMLPRVPIDSVVLQWNAERDTLARVLTYITDDMSTTNYYRRLLNYASLDSFPDQDFTIDDRLNTTPTIAFGTSYELTEGDTVFNAILHIEKAYYDYLESVQLAVVGNLNPFAQPSPIKSNVRGSANPLGIFTCLSIDRDTMIVRK